MTPAQTEHLDDILRKASLIPLDAFDERDKVCGGLRIR